MNLKVGDCVHYGAHGVCRVCGRESKSAGGSSREYFTLRPTGSENILLYLPVDAEPVKVRLRRLLSQGEIMKLIHDVEHRPAQWIGDSKVRRESWNQALRGGDALELIAMLKSLYIHQEELPAGKQLPMSDQELMHAAQRQLYSEFSYVLKIREDQVLPFILGQIQADPADTQ